MIIKQFVTSSLLAALVLASAGILTPAEAQADNTRIPLIRLYNSRINDHFYTTSRDEANQATKIGYRVEGDMGYILKPGEEVSYDSVLLYRLVDKKTGRHFYTTNGHENAAAAGNGYTFEGVIGYMPKNIPPDSFSSVYRLYHPRQQKHFYTTSVDEKNAVVKMGYNYEGILDGFVFANSGPVEGASAYSLNSGFNLPQGYTQQQYSTYVQLQYTGPNSTLTSAKFRNLPPGLTGITETFGNHNPGDTISYQITGVPVYNCNGCLVYLDVVDNDGHANAFKFYLTINSEEYMVN